MITTIWVILFWLSAFTSVVSALPQNTTTEQACNGDAALCTRRYNRILHAATHNSYAVPISSAVTAILPNPPAAANQNFDYTIIRQLLAGYRAFDLDLWFKTLTPPSTGVKNLTESQLDDLHVCHGGCSSLYFDGGKLTKTLQIFVDFLNTYPNEVLTIFIENGTGAKLRRDALSYALSVLKPFAFNVNSTYTNSTGHVEYWPTLGEMIASNERVVIFSEYGVNPLANPWILSSSRNYAHTSYQVFSISDFNCENASSNNDTANLIWRIDHQLNTKFSSFTDGNETETFYIPNYSTRSTVNDKATLKQRLVDCENAGVRPTYLSVDWGQSGHVLQIVAAYNNITFKPDYLGNYTDFSDTSSGLSFIYDTSSGFYMHLGIMMMALYLCCN